MTAQSAQVLDVALFQGLQRRVVGETGVDAHPNLGAGALVESPHQMRDPSVGVLGRAGVALAQQAAHHVAGLGQRGDQRRVDAGPVKAMIGRPALVAVDLDRQAVDVQRQLLGALAVLQRGQAPDHQSQQAFVHGIDIVAAPEAGQQPRQRGLRGPVLGQGRCPARIAAGQLPERITAQRVGIAEVDPAHRTLQHQGTQLAGQRMKDAQRVASIDQIVFQRLNHAAVVEGFTQQQGAAVAGGALAAELDTDRTVARGRPGG